MQTSTIMKEFSSLVAGGVKTPAFNGLVEDICPVLRIIADGRPSGEAFYQGDGRDPHRDARTARNWLTSNMERAKKLGISVGKLFTCHARNLVAQLHDKSTLEEKSWIIDGCKSDNDISGELGRFGRFALEVVPDLIEFYQDEKALRRSLKNPNYVANPTANCFTELDELKKDILETLCKIAKDSPTSKIRHSIERFLLNQAIGECPNGYVAFHSARCLSEITKEGIHVNRKLDQKILKEIMRLCVESGIVYHQEGKIHATKGRQIKIEVVQGKSAPLDHGVLTGLCEVLLHLDKRSYNKVNRIRVASGLDPI